LVQQLHLNLLTDAEYDTRPVRDDAQFQPVL
jgi:hypothetical protein